MEITHVLLFNQPDLRPKDETCLLFLSEQLLPDSPCIKSAIKAAIEFFFFKLSKANEMVECGVLMNC